RSSILRPNGKISRAMNARCASSTSPSKSSVPVLIRTALIEDREANVERPTSNVELRLSLPRQETHRSQFEIRRWTLGVGRLPAIVTRRFYPVSCELAAVFCLRPLRG